MALAGCGFTPVHGPGGAAEGLRGEIAVDAPRDEAGLVLVRQLEARLGYGTAARYRLGAEIRLSEEDLGVTPAQVITRYQLLGAVRFRLTEIATGGAVTSGEVSSFSSYSATDTPFATESARRDARDRLMVALADQVVARLLATAGDWR